VFAAIFTPYPKLYSFLKDYVFLRHLSWHIAYQVAFERWSKTIFSVFDAFLFLQALTKKTPKMTPKMIPKFKGYFGSSNSIDSQMANGFDLQAVLTPKQEMHFFF